MSGDWAAVAREVNARAADLGLSQKELAEESGVSLAIIREIQQDRIHRQRNPRTLEALSVALRRHPQYLAALLERKRPPEGGQAAPIQPDPVLAALNTIVREIRGLRSQIGVLNRNIESVISNGDSKPD